jgi:hypothetical protein
MLHVTNGIGPKAECKSVYKRNKDVCILKVFPPQFPTSEDTNTVVAGQ